MTSNHKLLSLKYCDDQILPQLKDITYLTAIWIHKGLLRKHEGWRNERLTCDYKFTGWPSATILYKVYALPTFFFYGVKESLTSSLKRPANCLLFWRYNLLKSSIFIEDWIMGQNPGSCLEAFNPDWESSLSRLSCMRETNTFDIYPGALRRLWMPFS